MDSPPTIPEMARFCRLPVSRFANVFSRQVGIQPADYVARRRIDTAKERLLGAPDKSITAIACDLGFATSQHFATVFKRYVGITPRVFRRTQASGPG
jgi:AraC-like DNA-binding protein